MVVVLSCCHPHSALWFPAYAGMTVWGTRRGIDGWCCLVHPCRPAAPWIADQVRNDGVVVLGV